MPTIELTHLLRGGVQRPNWSLFNGDCLDVLRDIPDNLIDSLVTDPPAGIGFMGKSWDHHKGGRDQWVLWLTEVMRECLRVMKPGAHGLVWAIPRTSHWTMTALENAGFEIRDVVTHLFGTGFPKSLDVSKAIDKEAGAKRSVIGQHKNPARSLGNGVNMDGGLAHATVDITAPATDSAKKWQGFGTALKPACEFWVLIRKPCSEKTVAKNVLKWGTGALNIDRCRVGTETIAQHQRDFTNAHGNNLGAGVKQPVLGVTNYTVGRFPANLVLDEDAAEALDEQSGMLKSGDLKPGHKQGQGRHTEEGGYVGGGVIQKSYGGDSGGASRFFYVAKASKSDRGEDNKHPTVKSTKLMSYLCRLVTPPNGAVLDPFMGSGSTGVAALSKKFKFVGIEKEKEYFKTAKHRL